MPIATIPTDDALIIPVRLLASNGVILNSDGTCADRYEDGTKGVHDDDRETAEEDDEPRAFAPGQTWHLAYITWNHTLR